MIEITIKKILELENIQLDEVEKIRDELEMIKNDLIDKNINLDGIYKGISLSYFQLKILIAFLENEKIVKILQDMRTEQEKEKEKMINIIEKIDQVINQIKDEKESKLIELEKK